MTSNEPRAENIEAFRERFERDQLWPREQLRIVQCDIAGLKDHVVGPHQIVFCYQVLNQTGDPERLLASMADLCTELFLLECAALSGPDQDREIVERRNGSVGDFGGSLDGRGCVPSRPWVFKRLQAHYAHVYMPLEQPVFDRFKNDWRSVRDVRGQYRAIFIASRTALTHPGLVERIPDVHHS